MEPTAKMAAKPSFLRVFICSLTKVGTGSARSNTSVVMPMTA